MTGACHNICYIYPLPHFVIYPAVPFYHLLQLTLFSEIFRPDEERLLSVSIDSTIGRRTRFTCSYANETLQLQMEVTSPDGTIYVAPGPDAVTDEEFKTLRIEIDDAQV